MMRWAVRLAVAALVGGTLAYAPPAHAESTFPAPAYESAACTPQAYGLALGIGPQQWNAGVGLPLVPTGTPLDQRIVIAEFGQLADEIAVNNLLRQCGLATVDIAVDANSWYSAPASPGDEATLDASVIAGALPANTGIVMANTQANASWYALLVTVADACGAVFDSDPSQGLSQAHKGPDFPAGGCIASISYGGSEAAKISQPDFGYANFMMDELAELGVIVVVSAGDEGSGGCISASGSSFGTGVGVPVTSVSVTSNIMTLTTSTTHGFTSGQPVFMSNLGPGLNRMYTVITTPTATTFTIALNLPDMGSTSVTAQAWVEFGGLEPQYLATNPNALAVGGTQWDPQDLSMAYGLAIGYVPGSSVQNFVWKDSNANPNCGNLPDFPQSGGEGTGGGQSSSFSMPAYQQNAAMANYPSAPAKRMIPDLAALAGWPMYAIANWGLPIISAEVASNVATLGFSASTGMTVGESVVIAGLTGAFSGLNGTRTITAVGSGSISFSYTSAAIPAASVSGGTATQTCPGNVYPCGAADFPWVPVVGTSAAAPLIAVGIANVNAVLSARGLATLTNGGGAMDVHNVVYGTDYRSAFTDVVDGNNDLQGLGGWNALPGYDMTTGMGVPNFRTLAALLVDKLTPVAPSGGSTSPVETTVAGTGTPVGAQEPADVATSPGLPVLKPPTVVSLGSGVLIADGPRAVNAPRVRGTSPANSRIRTSPVLGITAGRWTVPVVRVPSKSTPVGAELRVAGEWKPIGTFVPTSSGVITLPAMRLSRPGSYPIRFSEANGGQYFVRLDVARRDLR